MDHSGGFVLYCRNKSVDFLWSTGQQTFDLMVVRGRQDLKIQGPRLNQTKEDKMLVRHGPDRRLDPIITPPMPLMEVRLTTDCRDTHPAMPNLETMEQIFIASNTV